MKIILSEKNVAPFLVGIVASEFNQSIVNGLVQGALKRLEQLAIPSQMITLVWVPGAVEIPLMAQMLIDKQHCDAIICLGAVIRGETSHYDYVCQQVSYGCQKVAIENKVPVIFGVLTTDNEEQAEQRAGGHHGNKGSEAVDVAAVMINALRKL